uniref:Uncharacterized protein n=1 Tax=Magallana gigas TaxID=29159 RepID=K1P6S2_MAGGI
MNRPRNLITLVNLLLFYAEDGVDGSDQAGAHFHRQTCVFGYQDFSQSEFRIG